MSLSFPASPTTGQNYQQWAWDGSKWVPAQGTKQIGARVLLSSNVVAPGSPVASVQIIRTFDNTYDQYEIDGYDWQSSAEGYPMLSCSNDGSTWDITSGNYWNSGVYTTSYPTANTGAWVGATASLIFITPTTINPGATHWSKCNIRFTLPWTTDREKIFEVRTTHYSGNNGYTHYIGAGTWAAGSYPPLKGLRLQTNVGNITRGVFNLYGIVKAGAGGS